MAKVKRQVWTAAATDAFFEGLCQVSLDCLESMLKTRNIFYQIDNHFGQHISNTRLHSTDGYFAWDSLLRYPQAARSKRVTTFSVSSKSFIFTTTVCVYSVPQFSFARK